MQSPSFLHASFFFAADAFCSCRCFSLAANALSSCPGRVPDVSSCCCRAFFAALSAAFFAFFSSCVFWFSCFCGEPPVMALIVSVRSCSSSKRPSLVQNKMSEGIHNAQPKPFVRRLTRPFYRAARPLTKPLISCNHTTENVKQSRLSEVCPLQKET